jgi:hypothetical protein
MMMNYFSKHIARKQSRPVKASVKAIIPLWAWAMWVPEKENAAGKKTRSLKLELSTDTGNKEGKTLTFKSFKIFCSGSLEEWILWPMDYNKVCVGMSITLGAARNQMVCQILSDKPLKEFDQMLSTFTTETNANSTVIML